MFQLRGYFLQLKDVIRAVSSHTARQGIQTLPGAFFQATLSVQAIVFEQRNYPFECCLIFRRYLTIVVVRIDVKFFQH